MRPSVALSCLVWLFALLGPDESRAKAEPARAHSSTSYAEQTYFAGQRLFLEKRYEEALPLFEESFRLQRSPNSRLYIARCLAELGELLSAYETYREVVVLVSEVDQPAHYAATQMAASEERAALRQRLASIRVTLSEPVAGLRLVIGGREVPQHETSEEHLADPGELTIETSAPGYRPASYTLLARGGQVADVFVMLARASATPYVPPPQAPVVREVLVDHPGDDWAWLSAGVGLAGIATWGAFGIQAERRYQRILPACRAGECPLDQVETGRRETLISNIGLGVGMAGLAGAGALWLWSRAGEPEPRTKHPAGLEGSAGEGKSPARVGLVVAPLGASMVGEF
jgi:hypothetical protein